MYGPNFSDSFVAFCCVLFGLGLWKAIEICFWLVMHISFSWGA
jgi:hypothetical protein